MRDQVLQFLLCIRLMGLIILKQKLVLSHGIRGMFITLYAASTSGKMRLISTLGLGPSLEGFATPPVRSVSCCCQGVKANVVAPVSISTQLPK